MRRGALPEMRKPMNERIGWDGSPAPNRNWILRRSFRKSFFVYSLAWSFTVLGAALAWPLSLHSQTNLPPESAKSPDEQQSLSHDLSGVWMPYQETNVPPGTGKNVIDQATRPPLTPWGQARLDTSKPLLGPRAIPGQENSPSLKCDPDSPPKVLNHPNPFEIIQIPGRVFMFFEEQHIWRTIWADGRPLPKDPDPSWLGYAVGRWEGDAFVVETVGFNGKQWADPYGNPQSEQMHLTERYRRLNRDTLELQVTMDDPKSYTKPWVSPPKLFKFEPGWEIAEWFCVPAENKPYDETVRKPAGIAPSK
jgi:hypothetical protein